MPKLMPPSMRRDLLSRSLRAQSVRSSATTTYGTGILSTIAGGNFNQNGGTALNVGLGFPAGLVQDASGNSYMAAQGFNEVLKIDPSGKVTVIAGNGSGGYSGDGGPGTSAVLNSPAALALDNAGNLYIADLLNFVIRKLNLSTGSISTIAGLGPASGVVCAVAKDALGDGCPATQAQLGYVYGLAFSPQNGILYFTDGFGLVRQIDSTGTITVVAGAYPTPTICAAATDGYGDGCPATSSILGYPDGIAVDSSGRIFVADGVASIIRVIANGTIRLIAGQANMTGTPMSGYSGDGGPSTAALLFEPGTLFLDNYSNLYFVDAGNDVVRKISSGIISTVAGIAGKSGFSGDGGPATAANFNLGSNSGLAVDPLTGNLIIADSYNQRIRQVLPDSNVQTVAGNGYSNYFGAGGLATNAGIANPSAVAEDHAGNLYIADANNIVWKVNASSGVITKIAGTGAAGYSGDGGPAASAALNSPTGLAFDAAGNLYIADFGNQAVRKIDATTGIITTVAGGPISTITVCSGTTDGIGDGCPATQAYLFPSSVAVDAGGNLYIADSVFSIIREVSAASGTISSVAGTVEQYGFAGDGGPATSAKLFDPWAIVLDSSGNLYIADTYNYRIREVTASTGIIQTVAGNGLFGYSGDGGAATAASIGDVYGVFTDSAGNLYFSDLSNNVLREVDTTGTISTIAGTGSAGYSGDGGQATQGELSEPWGLLIDSSGNLIFADSNNSRVRKISAATTQIAPAVTVSPSPSSVTSAQALTVTVSVAGSGTNPVPSGAVSITGGGYTSTVVALASGSATFDIPAGALSVGTDTLTATYTPDILSSSTYSSATGTASVTVTAALPAAITPSVLVTPSATNITATQTLTVGVTIGGGTGNPIPTGTVTLTGGGYASATTPLASGSASISIPPGMLSTGSDTLTASYSGDANYSSATNTATVTVTSTTQVTATFNAGIVLNTGSLTLNSPTGMAEDSANNLYLADVGSNRIIEVTASGVASVVNVGTPGGTSLNMPLGVGVDNKGDIFIADTGNNRVVVVAASGTSSVLNAGTPGGVGLSQPQGVIADQNGNIYIADTANARVVEVTAAGSSQVLNVGSPGGKPLLTPTALAKDGAGNLFITDIGNSRIVEVTATGTASVLSMGSVALIEPIGLAVDSAGSLYIADDVKNDIVKVTSTGTASVLNDIGAPGGSTLNAPAGVAVDTFGNVFIGDTNNNRVVEVASAPAQNLGQISVGTTSSPVTMSYTIDGYSGSSYTPAFQLNYGKEMTLGAVTCTGGSAPETCSVPVTFTPAYPGLREDAVNVLDPTTGNALLTQTPAYGTGNGPLGAFSPATTSVLNLGTLTVMPQSTARDSAGNLYIADTGNSRIVQITSAGAASVLSTGNLTLSSPQGVAVDGAGNVYIADTGNNRVVEVSAAGSVSTLGTGTLTVDPQGIAVDGAGNVYLTDSTSRIVKIAPGGVVGTLNTGSLNVAYAYGVAVDSSGDVFIANQGQNNVVEVTAAGATSTVSTGSLTLSAPYGVAVDAAGDLYIADSGNNRIVEVTSAGAASVVAAGAPGGKVLGSPYGVTVDGAGTLYIADYGNNRIVTVAQGQAIPLSFASTNVGATSSDSPQAIALQNIGNQTLNLTALSSVTTGQTANSFNLNASGTTCTSTTALAAGQTCSVSVDFQPVTAGTLTGNVDLADNSLNAVSPNNVQQISLSGTGIALPTPTVTVTPSAASVTTAQSLSVAVAVAGGSGNPAPTGTVILTGGGYTSGATALSSGAATISIPAGSLSVGTDTLTVAYTPDTASSSIYNAASGTATVIVSAPVTPATFSMTASSVTVTKGSSGTSTLTASTTTGYAGTISFTCKVTSSPAGAVDPPSCTSSQAVTLSAGTTSGTATISVSTTAASTIALSLPMHVGPKGWTAARSGVVLAVLVVLWVPRRRRLWKSMLSLLMVAVIFGAMAGCGGGSSSSGTNPPPANPGTTSGAYTVTVTGTGNDSASTTATTTFTLTVN